MMVRVADTFRNDHRSVKKSTQRDNVRVLTSVIPLKILDVFHLIFQFSRR